MISRKPIIAVIGASQATPRGLQLAEAVGREIARQGAIMVCGGLRGVMEAAAKGCVAAGGETLGILPGGEGEAANPYITIAVATNMGHARNVIIAHTAEALIAVEGEYGTISEMAIGLKLGKPVLVLPGGRDLPGTRMAGDPQEAVRLALAGLQGE